MITPLEWSRRHPTYEMFEAYDPGVGRLNTSTNTSEDQITRFRFVPDPPLGMTISDAFTKSQEIADRLGDACFMDDEWSNLRACISAMDDVGYVYAQTAAERILDLARTRPRIIGIPDRYLAENGFVFRSHLSRGTKTYSRKVKTGTFIIWRSPDSVHLTFEFNRSTSWNNLFRLNTLMDGGRRSVLPDYLNLEIAVCLAIETARLYEGQGLTIRPSRRKKV